MEIMAEMEEGAVGVAEEEGGNKGRYGDQGSWRVGNFGEGGDAPQWDQGYGGEHKTEEHYATSSSCSWGGDKQTWGDKDSKFRSGDHHGHSERSSLAGSQKGQEKPKREDIAPHSNPYASAASSLTILDEIRAKNFNDLTFEEKLLEQVSFSDLSMFSIVFLPSHLISHDNSICQLCFLLLP